MRVIAAMNATLLSTVLLLPLLTGCGRNANDEAAEPPSVQAEIARVQAVDLPTTFEAGGVVRARQGLRADLHTAVRAVHLGSVLLPGALQAVLDLERLPRCHAGDGRMEVLRPVHLALALLAEDEHVVLVNRVGVRRHQTSGTTP